MNYSRYALIFSLIFFAMLSRLIPHPPNFTAITATALFSAFTLRDWRIALTILYGAMFLSDLILGLHSQMATVYFSQLLVVIISRYCRSIPLTIILSSLGFFIWVNFGVWLWDNLYPLTFDGLLLCYTAAVPFLRNQLIGDCFYIVLLFGIFSISDYVLEHMKKNKEDIYSSTF